MQQEVVATVQGIVSQYVQAVFSSYLVLKLMAFDRLDDLMGHVDSKCRARRLATARSRPAGDGYCSCDLRGRPGDGGC